MRKILVFTAAALIGSAAFAAGEIYRWKDANGRYQYSDQPRPGAELISRSASQAPPAPATATAPAPAAAPASPPPVSNALPVSREVANEVRQEAAASKAELCKQATEDYDKKIRALRIYKDDGKGNRIWYTEQELEASRMEARSVRDMACAP